MEVQDIVAARGSQQLVRGCCHDIVARRLAEAARAAGWTILRGLSCVLPGVALCVVLLLKRVHVQRIRLLSRRGTGACDGHFGGQVSAPFSSCRWQ